MICPLRGLYFGEDKFPLREDFSLWRLEITMETNPKDYDRRVSWISQQNQPSTAGPVTAQDAQQQHSRPQNPGPRGAGQKKRPPQKMPRARAQALATKLKRGLAISSIVGFGAFSGLVALHQVGSTTTQAASVSSQNSKSILKKQGGSHFETSTTPTATSKKSTATPTTTRKASKKSTVTPTATSVAAAPVSGTSTS